MLFQSRIARCIESTRHSECQWCATTGACPGISLPSERSTGPIVTSAGVPLVATSE